MMLMGKEFSKIVDIHMLIKKKKKTYLVCKSFKTFC